MNTLVAIFGMSLAIAVQVTSLWAFQKSGLARQLRIVLWLKKLALLLLLLSGGLLLLMPRLQWVFSPIFFGSLAAWFIFMLIFWTMWIASRRESRFH
jgi:hypothetical protein